MSLQDGARTGPMMNHNAFFVAGCATLAMNSYGEIQDADQAAANLTGYRVDDLRCLTIADLLVTDELPCQESGEIHWPDETPRQVLLRHKNGHLIPVAWKLSALCLGQQKIIIATVQMIRTAQEDERALSHTVEQLQLAIDTAKLGIWRLDIDSGRLDWNDQQLEIYGISREAYPMNLNGWRSQVHPDDLDDADNRLAEAFEGKSVYDIAFRLTRPSGEIRNINASAAPVYDEGRLIEIIGINIDVTEQKRAEQELRVSEARFRALFNAMPTPTYTWQHVDGDFILTDYNAAALENTEGKVSALVGVRASDLYHDTPEIRADLEACFQQKTIVRREMRYQFRSVVKSQIVDVIYVYVPDDIIMVRAEDITERKRIEQALLESEARFRALMKQSPFPTAIFAPDGTLLDGNTALRQLWRLSPEAGAADGRYNALTSKRNTQLGIGDAIKRAFAGETVLIPLYESDARLSLKEFGLDLDQGEPRWLRSHYYPIKNSTGELVYVVLVHEDVTDQKRADDALKESQDRYEKAFYHSPMPMSVVNAITRERLEVNNSYSELTGYSREELVGKIVDTLPLLIPPEDMKRAAARFLAEGRIRDYPAQIRTKQGDIKDVLLYGTLMTMGEKPLSIFTVIDVTERNRTDKRLRQLSQAIEQSPISVIITNTQGEIEYVNPKFCEVTGYSQDEVIGETPRILKSGVHSAEFYQDLWQTITSGRDWRGELCNRKKDGQLYWESAYISGVKDANDQMTHFVAVKEDNTERRRIEEEHARQERLAAVGQLAAGIAHDFNNILAVILIYAQMLSKASEVPARFRERAAIIEQQSKHATNLVQQILDFSRRSILEKQPLNLLPLLKEQVKLLERTLPKNIQVWLEYGEEIPMVTADPTRMQQIVTNLAVNARDAMPHGGVLHIELSTVTFAEGDTLPVDSMAMGQWLKISITDTGTGMNADVMAHIFEPFFTTKDRGRGTGLGLAQVYGIVKQHQGYITVTSQIGEGTTFNLYFPPLPQVKEEMANIEEATETPQGAGQRILLVDDNQDLQKILTELLCEWNYQVLSAASGREALQILADEHGAIDLVISDVIMPHLGGEDLLTHIQARYPHLPVVFVTGQVEEGVIGRYEAMGVRKCLTKPLNLTAIARTLLEVMGKPLA